MSFGSDSHARSHSEDMARPDNLLLEGIVGSTAYGLAREGSDIDTLGIFTADPRAFWLTSDPVETYHGTDPDFTYHELAKYCRLALKCNPTLIELLWLPSELYTHRTIHGNWLIEIRQAFLSEKYVRDAFGGYAKQQVERLVRRNSEGKEGFSSDTAKRTAKHARHCFRLLAQGRQLLETGELTVKVDDPERYWAFDGMAVDEVVATFTLEDIRFKKAESVLPEKPDFDLVEKFLLTTREAFL